MVGLMVPTWFLSMWISNTAATSMMLPIIQAVIKTLEEVQKKSRKSHEFCSVKINILQNILAIYQFLLFYYFSSSERYIEKSMEYKQEAILVFGTKDHEQKGKEIILPFHLLSKRKLKNVFVKRYAHTILAPKDNRGTMKILWNLSKRESCHLHYWHNLYAKHHDPSPSGSPDSLFTRS